ncbi:MAG TPA: hypothetical protein VOA80_13650 [Thermoanaerobaculia bacterium]|nr:hypothetical protein [Thermoanaerobaculia bacterium]
MKPESTPHDDNLMRRIRAKRSQIATYLNRVEPTANRLTTFATICSAIAGTSTAVLTIALSTTPSIRLWWLSAGATASSALAGSANHWYKSRDLAARILKAQATDAKLEALETLIEIGQIPLKDAAARYERCVLEVPFVTWKAELAWKRAVPLELVEGEITQPVSGQHVGDPFICSGSATVPLPDVHFWLALEIEDRIWPKETEVTVKEDGSWSKTVFEEGTSETFAISLFAANPQGHRYIQTWLRSCDKQGTYPELRRTPGMIRLSRVTALTRTLPPTAGAPASTSDARIQDSSSLIG